MGCCHILQLPSQDLRERTKYTGSQADRGMGECEINWLSLKYEAIKYQRIACVL